MIKYTCLNPISRIGLDKFSADYVITDDFSQADIALVRSAKLHDVEFPESLLAIGRAGAGVNNIPLEECAAKGIVVFNTPGANANGVKELVLAGMLMAARDIVGGIEWAKEEKGNPDIAKQAEKEKKQFAGTEISGKKLGIIGLGAIGQMVANAAVHLGMDVYGYDPYISVDAAWNLSRSVHHIQDVNDIYRTCDYITIHVPALDSTKGMISREAIAMMKPTTVILNYARDVLVDEQAVVEALKEGRLRKYMTDFANPTVSGAENVVITPHLGASTEEAEDNCAVMAVKELRDFVENGNIRNSVNLPNCDMGVCDSAGRVAIIHKNEKNMITQYAGILGDAGLNIAHFTDVTRGEYAYSIIDVDSPVTEKIVEDLRALPSVMKVRVIK
ncbi:MAG: 3-phosphoglycerate dehydrogenase family protein [Lachnospiraceae bacterium]|nr:3-phosphoglycerate dehydrogenase family protein [Lachnospiraceae bacterium]